MDARQMVQNWMPATSLPIPRIESPDMKGKKSSHYAIQKNIIYIDEEKNNNTDESAQLNPKPQREEGEESKAWEDALKLFGEARIPHQEKGMGIY